MTAVPILSDDDVTEPHTTATTALDLFDTLDRLIGRFVAFPTEHARHAVVLWIGHTHALDAFDSTPRLAFISPEKGSGKTRALEVLDLVTPTPLHAVNMSAAALYRLVGDKQPTLLLDECDTYLGNIIAKQHEDLRGLINAGHRRGAMVYRGEIAGKSVKVVEFPAFAAVALAGIGDLPDTVMDRSIVIGMKRRAPNEHVDAFRERMVRPETDNLRDQLTRWGIDSTPDLTDAWPTMPDGITDRAADVWEPLLAVADAIGGPWPDRARTAAVALNNARAQRDPSLGIQLLSDCRRVFTEHDIDRLTTEHLVEHLCALDESPWGELRGKPIDARGVARRLRKYEVRPGNHRFGDEVRKGYRLEDFHDAWSRYLPPVTDVADVAHPSPQAGGNGDVAHVSDDLDHVLPNNTEGERTPTTGNGQHPLQAQLSGDF
jgi:Protein of unknown function (DUF3631)